jgi:hypothetical protein
MRGRMWVMNSYFLAVFIGSILSALIFDPIFLLFRWVIWTIEFAIVVAVKWIIGLFRPTQNDTPSTR